MKLHIPAQSEHIVTIGENKTASGAFAPLSHPRKRRFYGKAQPGDLILTDSKLSVTKRFGSQDQVQNILQALLYHSGERDFDQQAKSAAQSCRADTDLASRRDLRDLITFTIDGDYSKDFDDAISARREDGDNIRVWVHVADVTAYLVENSPLDQLAQQRATSIYLPTDTRPMLPETLSNGVCSLVPGKQRLALTCEMLLSHGEVLEYELYRSTIISDARLTYNHVNQIFLGNLEPGPTYAAALAAARQASRVDTLEVETTETEPCFEIKQGRVVGITYPSRGKSEVLIERLMILANQTVAKFLAKKAPLGLYRVHDGQSELKMQAALMRLQRLGVPADTFNEAAFAVKEMSRAGAGDPDRIRAMLALVRNVNVAAQYSTKLAPHEGLAIDHYTHFTSPIRRYADVIVHRMILAAIGVQDMQMQTAQIETLIAHCNERTRHAKKLERRSQDICYISHFASQNKVGDTMQGMVCGMSENGIFVDLGIRDGFIFQRSLGGSLAENGFQWQSEKLGTIDLLDRVKVKITRLDLVQGRVGLELFV